MSEVRITHNDGAGRYELYLGDALASVAEYRSAGGRLIFHHTETYPTFRGRGLAEQLVRWALDDVASRDGLVTPTCWFVADFIELHPEYKPLLWQEGSGRASTKSRSADR